MIGNDIVDLALAKSSPHWKTQRFLDKVFCNDEQQVIKQAEDRFLAIWQLWSMKESAYKSHIRYNHIPFFAPAKITCHLRPNFSGLVSINNTYYSTYTQINKNFIHTISYSGASSDVLTDIGKLEEASYKNQHNKSNRCVLEVLSSLVDVDIEKLAIKKNESDVPVLYKQNVKQSTPISITHHGNYFAYAIINFHGN